MSVIINTILKEFFVEIHGHSIKARIMSPINTENTFTFQVSKFFKSKSDADPSEPSSTFSSYANAERHLLGYLEAFKTTLDLGGEVAEGIRF